MINPIRLNLLALGAFLLVSTATAQTTATSDTVQGWTTGGSTGLNFTQVKLSNWAGGGQSSISVASLLKLAASYRMGPSLWENNANLAFGLVRQGEGSDNEFRKTDDVLELRSRYNHNLSENFYVTGTADFRTQMGIGYEYSEQGGETVKTRISEFMAPGFLLTSIGATYKKPDRFTLMVSPVTGKFTFVNDQALSDAGAFGVEPGERIRSEFGASLQSEYKREIWTNVTFNSSLSLFGNYQTFNHIDVNWEGSLVMKVNRFINSMIAAQLIYDHDVLQATQFRNVINVGFLYQWPEGSKKE